MNKRSETIEIKAPPVETLNRRRPSCIRRGCFTGCGGLFILLIGGLIFLRAIATPNTVKTGLLPKGVSAVVPVYDADAIETVRITKRSDAYQTVTAHPLFKRFSRFTKNNDSLAEVPILPTMTDMDRLDIQWIYLSAQPSFIFRYYQDELKKAGYEVRVTENTEKVKELIFSQQKPVRTGTLIISDTNRASGTDAMHLSLEGDLSDL
jgi:hypothetical protein